MRKSIDDDFMSSHRRGCSAVVLLITVVFIGLYLYDSILWPFLITVGLFDLGWIIFMYFSKSNDKGGN
jgi:hypothetical protein